MAGHGAEYTIFTQLACNVLSHRRENKMLYYALLFLLIAIVAAVAGFGGLASISAAVAKALFFAFVIVFFISLLFHFGRRA